MCKTDRRRRSGLMSEGEPVFQEARAPSRNEFAGLLDKIIARLLKMLTRQDHLVEEQGVSYIADMDADNPLASLQAASCTYRIAQGPRAGQKVLSLRTLPTHLPARTGSTTLPSASGHTHLNIFPSVDTVVRVRRHVGLNRTVFLIL